MTDMHREAFNSAMRRQAELAYQFALLLAGKPNTYREQALHYRDEQEKGE